MRVPIEGISPDALMKIAEEFVLREGTDYGNQEYSLKAKAEQVIRQLQRGDAVLVFDAKTESIDIVSPQKAAAMTDYD